jgi:protein SCO1/2
MMMRAKRRASAAASTSTAVQPADGRLPTLWEVPSFAFANTDGRVIGESALRGHVWIADFIFTRCTIVCPILTTKMTLLRRSIPSADIRFVSFSVDPENDTPAVLKAYAGKWNPDPRWLLLSPPPAKVIEFAKAMKVPFQHTTMPLEPILHTSLFFLVDRRGRVRGIYGGVDDAAVLRLVTDATMLDANTETGANEGSKANREPPVVRGGSHGFALFQAVGCAPCHADPKTGPPLAGLAGRMVRLEGGDTALADDAYLRQSIVAPGEKVVAGYNPLMPTYRDFLTKAEVDDLVAYLHSIAATDGAASAAPPRAGSEAGIDVGTDVEVQDPVCGMKLKRVRAAAHADYHGRVYYFCSDRCHDRFIQDPARYARLEP